MVAGGLRVLLVDDDSTFRKLFGQALEQEGFSVESAADGLAGLELMNRKAFDLAVVDLRMPGMDGLSLLSEMKRRHPGVTPIVLTGFGSIPSAVEATRSGAFDVLSKTTPIERVLEMLRNAADHRRASRREKRLAEALFTGQAFFGMVGKSPAMTQVFRTIERFQPSDQPVLITGETGTGKELVARAIHAGSPRRDGPLIAINCASLKDNFVENELFGHVRGAFTGATNEKRGLFAMAEGGSLHIDEIGRIPESSQAALLRVLDFGTYRPLGATSERKVDVRIIATTNEDMEAAVESDRFRKDLFYRLSVCRIHLPPLRDRPGDIPLLVNHFLDSSPAAISAWPSVTEAALDALLDYDWPGNVRELLGCMQQAVLLADKGDIDGAHIRLRPPRRESASARPIPDDFANEMSLEDLEQRYVTAMLQRKGNNLTEVARILRVDPTTLRRKLRRWRGRD